MPVIAFANPREEPGRPRPRCFWPPSSPHVARVAIIDADPERWISQWGALPGKPATITILGNITEDTIVDQIEAAAAEAQFVVVDLEGTASLMVANAIGMSDLVIIPTQGASMDAKGAAKTIKLIRNQARSARRDIPHAVLDPYERGRGLAGLEERPRAARQGRDRYLRNPIVERAAYRDILDYGGLLGP